jgi:formamidopyrimidine-DNA glycosylase
MPELPEVETMVRDLAPRIAGQRIVGVDASFPGAVVWPEFEEFKRRVTQQEIRHVSRRGKFAIFGLSSEDALIIHRGMTGSLLLRSRHDPMESYVRLRFQLDGGSELRFNDPRKFGKVFVMNAAGAERPLPWAEMGPEPLNGDFTLKVLRTVLQGRTGVIKPLLLNQRLVAGLGNIYVDEALHQARIHPQRRANSLTAAEIKRLHEAIPRVLASAIERRGTTFSSYQDIEGRAGEFQTSLQVFRREGAACYRCGTQIVRLVVGGRGTHICPTCQKA